MISIDSTNTNVQFQTKLYTCILQVQQSPNLFLRIVDTDLQLIDDNNQIKFKRNKMLEFPTALLVHRGKILLQLGCANLIDLITQKKYQTDYTYDNTPTHAISLNNYLYIHVNSEINIVHNKKLKFIQQCSGFLVQFCENIYSVSFELEHVIFKSLKGRINKLVFIAKQYQQYNSIFVVANDKQILFFSLATQKSKVVQCQDLNLIQELGRLGYQLQKQSVEQIFGEEEFLIQQKQMNEYLNQNQNYFDQNCKQVIKYIKGDKYNEQIEAPQIQTYLYDFQHGGWKNNFWGLHRIFLDFLFIVYMYICTQCKYIQFSLNINIAQNKKRSFSPIFNSQLYLQARCGCRIQQGYTWVQT
ncbi:Hypothetical_protein [Hexamita inflata]|uniref:Hypothetical_protein n=1 Tax=Hexamita inflata TaxID=28002 RepID=A0AA86TSX1_9EUKA|nr:Hypothetical protein HINF_LOCUS14820 [Hexamita inflata]